jgi:SagB-type dehydrogenase family enzyme
LPRPLLGDLFMGQPYIGDAAAVIVLTTVLERTLWKYSDRGYRYILLEAGHVAQNLNLVASGLGLGALNLGGFFDANLAALLGLDPEAEVPLYGIAVGTPGDEERNQRRQPIS